ncbi:MAG TPA: peptidoglycan-binding domain-containing protein [Candidatus Dormibacteraeota bacterium]
MVSPRTIGAAAATALVVAVAGAAVVAGNPFRPRPGAADGPPATSLATVARRSLSSQTSVSGTLGYAGSYSVSNQYTPSAVAAKARHAVDAARTAYDDAVAQAAYTNQVDASRVAADQSQLGQDQARFAADGCASHATTPPCAQDQQAVSADQARLGQDQVTQKNDQLHGQASVDAARAALVQAQDNQATGGAGGGPGGGGGSSIVVTWLPGVGDVVDRGQPVYRANGVPITLLFGDEPLSRQLAQSVSGHDVQELEQNLLALGYAGSGNLQADGTFTAADTAAVKRWQQALGVPVTGVVDVGDVVVLSGAARVTHLQVAVGAAVSSGAQILSASSTARQVVVQLDAARQSQVRVGDQVTVVLPNQKTTAGTVAAVGRVATQPSPGATGQGSSSTPTVEVDVTPGDPAATGTIDQAPVQVSITTATVADALVVPVTALLAQPGGEYAVEVAGTQGSGDRLLPVTLGLFDDADGLVQVSGPGLAAGLRVVVPGG